MQEETPQEEKAETTQEEKIESSSEELCDYKDKYLRLLAENENMRKRMQKEKQDTIRFAIENVVTDMLEPIDNLENALKCTDSLSDEAKNWAMGFQMILDQMKEVLSQHGVSSFNSEGELFDTNLHYAIESEETDAHPEGTILKEYMKGYRSKEHTIRPAKVKVAVKPKQETKEGE